MLLEAQLEPVDQISESVLYSIINLYVRVQEFAHFHWLKILSRATRSTLKKSKDKSLRKEISRSCNEQEQANGRQD